MREEKLDVGDRHAVFLALLRIGGVPIKDRRASLHSGTLSHVYTKVHTISHGYPPGL